MQIHVYQGEDEENRGRFVNFFCPCSILIPQDWQLYPHCSSHSGITVKKLVKGWKGTATPAKGCLSWSIGGKAFFAELALIF